MRLICPNCDAQYEVDDTAIPESGRDVQCSNCGHAWFETLAREDDDDLLADAAHPDQAPISARADQPAPSQPATARPEDSRPASDEDEDDGEDIPPPPAADAPRRRGLDESVLAVLREEAERETEARRAEPAKSQPRPIETQTELGLEDISAGSVAAADAARRRLAHLKGDESRDLAPIKGGRRELLPDIEEINSTLRASDDRQGALSDFIDAEEPEIQARSGFRTGFVLMMMLTVVAALTYTMAPRIIEQIPQAGATLESYVSTVDKGRLALDALMQRSIDMLKGN